MVVAVFVSSNSSSSCGGSSSSSSYSSIGLWLNWKYSSVVQ